MNLMISLFLISLKKFILHANSSYRGYIHQLKYTNGRTYGDHTKSLHNKRIAGELESFDPAIKADRNQNVIYDDLILKQRSKSHIPQSTGGNKLTDKMISGYTG